jgi:hypothetical protein
VDEDRCREVVYLLKPGLDCSVEDNLVWATREIISQLKAVEV